MIKVFKKHITEEMRNDGECSRAGFWKAHDDTR